MVGYKKLPVDKTPKTPKLNSRIQHIVDQYLEAGLEYQLSDYDKAELRFDKLRSMDKYKDSYCYDLQRLYKIQVKDKVYAYYITREEVTVDYNPFPFDRRVYAHSYPIPNFTREPETGDILEANPSNFKVEWEKEWNLTEIKDLISGSRNGGPTEMAVGVGNTYGLSDYVKDYARSVFSLEELLDPNITVGDIMTANELGYLRKDGQSGGVLEMLAVRKQRADFATPDKQTSDNRKK
jgi:hypothetical protein